MALLVAVIFGIAAVSAVGQDIPVTAGKKITHDAQKFNYYSLGAKEVVGKLLIYPKSVDEALTTHLENLKSSNSATVALKKYKQVKSSIKDSKCTFTTDEGEGFDEAQEKIESIITTCVQNTPQDDKKRLNKIIADSIAQVQEADGTLRRLSEECSPLAGPLTPTCREEKNKALTVISGILSPSGFVKISSHFRSAIFHTKLMIDACVEGGIKEVNDNLEEGIKHIENCKDRLNQEIQKETPKEVDDSLDFHFFSKEAKQILKRLHAYFDSADEAFVKHVERLQKSNSASTALQKYQEAVDSVKGSKCAAGKPDENRFNGAQENIEAIIMGCIDSNFQEHMEEAKTLIKESLVKVKEADDVLRKNAQGCSSSSDVSPDCEEEKKKAVDSIRSVLSHGKFATISSAFFIPKVKIDSCIEDATKDLQDNLRSCSRDIEDCKATLKE